MESLPKNRLLFWILIFLIVVNISALATYFIFPNKHTPVSCSDNSPYPGCVLHSELNLSDVQIDQVDEINSIYYKTSRPVSEKIKTKRAVILDELASNLPDTVKMYEVSEEISGLQNQLHRENIRHYLELKKVCNDDQALRLSNLYRDLYGCPMKGKGNRRQHPVR